MLRTTIIISLFGLLSQVIGFLTHITIAALFGASRQMDAYLAADMLPQYVTAVVVISLGFVFIPVFADYVSTGRENEAWKVASGVLNLSVLFLGALSCVGVLFAESLLQYLVPGLPADSLALASRVAMITWPAIVATGIVGLLTGMYQVLGRFGWPAAVPVVGALVNLGTVLVLAPSLGVIGVAIGSVAGLVIQLVLLHRLFFSSGHYQLSLHWQHPGVRQVGHLLWPLLLSGLLINCTSLVERYLASSLKEGSISHLAYAFRLTGAMASLLSQGITTVIFPKLAISVAQNDLEGLKHTVSLGLRLMWVAVVPAVTIGAVLALPLVTVVYTRGQFNTTDAENVAGLFRIFLVALSAMCLSNITGRTFYALKATRFLAVIGCIEAGAYVVYAIILAHQFGLVGIAWSYVIYFNLSLLWHLVAIRSKTGKTGGTTVLVSFARTGVAAGLGATVAWLAMIVMENPWSQLVCGGMFGLVVYAVALFQFKSSEAWLIWKMAVAWRRPSSAESPLATLLK